MALGEIWDFETVGFINDEETLANLPDQNLLSTNLGLGDIHYKDQNRELIPGGTNNYGLSNNLIDAYLCLDGKPISLTTLEVRLFIIPFICIRTA